MNDMWSENLPDGWLGDERIRQTRVTMGMNSDMADEAFVEPLRKEIATLRAENEALKAKLAAAMAAGDGVTGVVQRLAGQNERLVKALEAVEYWRAGQPSHTNQLFPDEMIAAALKEVKA